MNTPFRILARPLPASPNFYAQDPVFQDLLSRHLAPDALAWLTPQLSALGARAMELTALSQTADKLSPQLRQYDRLGQRIDAVDYHPSYRDLERIGYGSGMIAMKYEPELRARFGGQLQVAGFALTFLFSQTESGMTCPACMTDGVARVLELHGSDEQQKKWIPRLASRDVERLLTGAMFLTEKQGGSDVGKNATRAVKGDDGKWRLYGEKWFCSNVDAGLKLVLARPDGAPDGTRGLGLFLLPHHREDGSRNALRIDRLKEKLGVRSMASGECVLEGCEAELVGELESGFKQMAEMLNLSRVWNAICSVACMRRAAWEATTYLRSRETFGKTAIDHALVRESLADLNAEEIGAKYLVFQLAAHLDEGSRGDERAKQLVRILTPLAKYTTAKHAVWAASEGIELLGGNGYIEEAPMARMLRDAQVLPVWEGTTNILVLDTMRVISRTAAHETLIDETRRRVNMLPPALEAAGSRVVAMLDAAIGDLPIIASEGPEQAGDVLKRFTDRLLFSYEISLLLDAARKPSPVQATLAAAARRLLRRHFDFDARTSRADVDALVQPVVTAQA